MSPSPDFNRRRDGIARRAKLSAAQLRQLPFVATPAVKWELMSAFGGKPNMMRSTRNAG